MNEMRDKAIEVMDDVLSTGMIEGREPTLKRIADALIEAGLIFNPETDVRAKECGVKTDYFPYRTLKERYSCSLCFHRLGKRDKYCGGCGAKINTKAEADKKGE